MQSPRRQAFPYAFFTRETHLSLCPAGHLPSSFLSLLLSCSFLPAVRKDHPAGIPAAVPGPEPAIIFNETLVAFVDEAVRYAQAHGKEDALLEFSNPDGSFVRGELYIYAYDFDDVVLAHPFSPERIGTNRTNERDAYGNLYSYKFINAAKNGSGFVRFAYSNPARNKTIEEKLGYVKKVDDTWWLGSGVYTGPARDTA